MAYALRSSFLLGALLVCAWGALPAQAASVPSPSPSPSASPSSLPIRGVTADTQAQPSGASHVERPPLRGGRR